MISTELRIRILYISTILLLACRQRIQIIGMSFFWYFFAHSAVRTQCYSTNNTYNSRHLPGRLKTRRIVINKKHCGIIFARILFLKSFFRLLQITGLNKKKNEYRQRVLCHFQRIYSSKYRNKYYFYNFVFLLFVTM